MIVAIAVTGNSEDAQVANRFARCPYFAIYDTAGKKLSFLKNAGAEQKEEAGGYALAIMRDHKVHMAISGNFGSRIKPQLDDMQIQLIIIPDMDRMVSDVLKLLKNSKM